MGATAGTPKRTAHGRYGEKGREGGGGEDKYGREYIINTCVRGKCRDGDGGNGDLWPTKETAGGRPGQTDRRRNGVNGAHDEIYEDTKGAERLPEIFCK